MSTPINPRDAWQLARIREGVAVDLESLSDGLPRQVAQAMMQANGRGRPGALADFLASLGNVPLAFAVDDAIKSADPSGPPPDEPPGRYTIHWADEALEPQPPQQYAIDKVCPIGGVSLWYGPPGSKKTFLAMDAAVSTALGEDWLAFSVKQGPVLIVDEESGERRLKRRLGEIIRGHEAGQGLPIAFTSLERFNLRDPLDTAHLSRLIETVQPVLVVIDALADVTPGADENAVRDMQPALMALRELAERHQTAIIVLHHTAKAGNYRGSTAIAGAVDLMLEIDSKPGSANVDCVTTKTRDCDPFCFAAHFQYSPEDGLAYFLRSGNSKPKGPRLNRAEQYVIDRLVELKQATGKELREAAALDDVCSAGTARNAVFSLAQRGLIRRCDGGGSGSVASYELVPVITRQDGGQ